MRRRIVGLAVGLVFVFALIIDLLHFYRESGHVVRLSTDRLRAIVVTAAAAIDGDAHAELNGCLDRRCPNYEKLSRYLKTVQDANGLATEIYTLQKVGIRTRFIIRTNQDWEIGLPYKLRPEMEPVFDRGEVVTTGVYGDMFGQWVSAYAPIRDSLGRVVALLEADYRVQQVLDQLWRELLEFLLFTWVGLTVTFLLARRLSTRLAQPLQELTAAVDAAAAGDNERELPKDAPDEIGRLARHFGVMREAIQRARMNERLAVVGQMAGSLVHDLRGPIQVISGNAELLPGEEEPQERAKMATRIVEQGRRMEAMCQDVLEFTRGRHTLAFSSFAASSLVDDVLADLAPVAARRAVRLARGPTSEQQVSGDADKLRRVLYNLGKNAIEAVGSGKTVELGCSVEAERWKLTVRDEGPGIPPEVAERLFQPFATHGKSGGTGLGLAIVKSVADAHGGSVRFETAAGSGTTFSVELPRTPAAPAPKPAAG